MSDSIPFDIQMEIIKKVSNVKSLIRFRSVSKPWKSYIDSSKFIKHYSARHKQTHSCTLVDLRWYKDRSKFVEEAKYIFCDDNNQTFKQQLVTSPLVKQCSFKQVVGVCQGLLCLYASFLCRQWMIVIWNPSIGKSFGIVEPSMPDETSSFFGFGICPVTSDLTVVKLGYHSDLLCSLQVFTLSSGVWTAIPESNWPRKSIRLVDELTSVVIDRFIYWGAFETTYDDDGIRTHNPKLLSFDLSTKEFRVLDLPDSMTNELYKFFSVSVCKLKESLVVSGCIDGGAEEGLHCGVWVMETDSSFTKLFTIGAFVAKILGFRKSGEPIFQAIKDYGVHTTIDIYDPCSQQIKNLGIDGIVGGKGSLFIDSYKESLLLLDHSDLQIYANHNLEIVGGKGSSSLDSYKESLLLLDQAF